MNIIFVFTVRDGMNLRNWFETEVMPESSTKSEIDARGDEINRDSYPDDELADGFYWDSSMETAGCYSRYVEIRDEDSYKIIQGII